MRNSSLHPVFFRVLALRQPSDAVIVALSTLYDRPVMPFTTEDFVTLFPQHSAYWRKTTLRTLAAQHYLRVERGTHGHIMRYTLLDPFTGIPFASAEHQFSDNLADEQPACNALKNHEIEQKVRISTHCTVQNTTQTLLYSDQRNNDGKQNEKPLFCLATQQEIDKLARSAQVSIRWLTQIFTARCTKFPTLSETEQLTHLRSMIQYVSTQKVRNFASYLEYCYLLSYEEFKFPATFGVETLNTPPAPALPATKEVPVHGQPCVQAIISTPPAQSSSRSVPSDTTVTAFSRVIDQEAANTFDALLAQRLKDTNIQLTRKVLAGVMSSEQKAAQLRALSEGMQLEQAARLQRLANNA